MTTPTPPTMLTATMPTFLPVPGTFAVGQSVALADTTTGATIYYTTDGTTPTTGSKTYSSAIPFTVDTMTLPVAWGWQSWETVSAGVTGASGVHELFIVFQDQALESRMSIGSSSTSIFMTKSVPNLLVKV